MDSAGHAKKTAPLQVLLKLKNILISTKAGYALSDLIHGRCRTRRLHVTDFMFALQDQGW